MSEIATPPPDIEVDARHGRYRQIVLLAIPIILALTSHSLIGLVDVWLIGNLGQVALAAVGLAGFAQFAAGATMFGLTPAVQATVGREVGRGMRRAGVAVINTGLLAAALLGTALAAILYAIAPWLIGVLSSDPAVSEVALPYFRARTFGLPAEGLIYALEGYWFAQGLTRRVMITTLTMHVFNAALSYALIFGEFGLPELGALGAGIGTAAGLWLGTLIYLGLLRLYITLPGLFRQLTDARATHYLIALAIPASLLDVLVATGWTSFLSIIGQLGTDALAVVTVALQLVIVVLLPAHGFGLAGGTLVAWAMGRDDHHDARRWGWQVCAVAIATGATLGTVLALLAEPLLGVFLDEARLVSMGIPLLYLAAVVMAFDGFGAVLQHTLQAAGATHAATLIGGSGMWLICVPVSWLLGPVLGLSLTIVWSTLLLYRGCIALGYALYWRSGGWMHDGRQV